MQRLCEDSSELASQVQQRSEELNSLSADRTRLELELAMVTEKHRTAQQEVQTHITHSETHTQMKLAVVSVYLFTLQRTAQ